MAIDDINAIPPAKGGKYALIRDLKQRWMAGHRNVGGHYRTFFAERQAIGSVGILCLQEKESRKMSQSPQGKVFRSGNDWERLLAE